MGRRTLSDSVLLSSLDPFDLMNLSYKGKSHSVSFHGSYELNLKSSTRSPDSGRKYVKGDPLRMIDWKAYARSNQLIVRETARESSVHVGLFCCLEESMFWPDHDFLENHEGTTKS